jgi:hypothetical protein
MKRHSFSLEELIALYLLEHPEDADGFVHGTPDGWEEPTDLIQCDVALRFGAWGVKAGYFRPEDHARFVAQHQRTRDRDKDA